MESMIFLGAGASASFDIPTINRMTEAFLDSKEQYKDKISQIDSFFNIIGFRSHIENYLSYARGQNNLKETILTSNPFISYYVCHATWNEFGYFLRSENIINDIEGFIYEKCKVNEYQVERIVQHYSDFLNILIKKYYNGEIELSTLDVDVFTTNYDNVIELFATNIGIDYFNGYVKSADGTAIFNPTLYEDWKSLKLYKLHGSITLGVVENISDGSRKIIERIGGFNIGDMFDENWRVVDSVMIHGYEKDPSKEPYFDLLMLLKNKIASSNLLIVVGYSFSDVYILNVFQEALDNRNDEYDMIIIDKNATRIKREIFNNNDHVIAIDDVFFNYNLHGVF